MDFNLPDELQMLKDTVRKFVDKELIPIEMHTIENMELKPDIRERFGFAVKSRREELGLTQEEFADKAGVHRTYLSDIERGSRNVSLINIERIALGLALKISELFHVMGL